ncbi:MAG TPA: sn-glycerol-3-phosphate ABC transporter ATP-binding protein UgpC [bacterium]|nr:sn-glycerol-3-phosphate ABC transporter ATP-binding protein UgpC [bacterium]
MARVVLKDVRKSFDKNEVVHGISLDIADGEFLVLVGPSGCGKSTVLRMVAGLEDVTSGEVYIGERMVNAVQPMERDIAMVFQTYALYPHMTVFKNMAYGLKLRKLPKAEIKRAVEEAADILNIRELLNRKPQQLSGGQRQRVAMGRCIVRKPQVFLFDEPLSNLDAKLRVQMRMEIKKLHERLRTTIVYVTHDQVEAMTLADRIVVLNAGNIEQVGSPGDLYNRPVSRFVAGFIGSPAMNFIACRLLAGEGGLAVEIPGGPKLPVPEDREARYQPYVGREMMLGLRPEHLTDERHPLAVHSRASFPAHIEAIEPTGMDTIVYFTLDTTLVSARVSPDIERHSGDLVTLTAAMNHMHLIDPATDKVV